MTHMRLPTIIQGGMGAGVSDWRLARAVSMAGQLGVVSGTALDTIMARRLQLGDLGGHIRRALAHFPVPDVAQRILDRYFVSGGKNDESAFKSKSMPTEKPNMLRDALTVAANFVEVFLAKEGHDGQIGINYLEKIQLPTLPSLYGAMLAGVNWVLMGAGIPKSIPGFLDGFVSGKAAELKLYVHGEERDDKFVTRFDPQEFFNGNPPQLHRPKFMAIVASATLAQMLSKKSTGNVDGFVIEGPTAGGHNAPPRGKLQLDERGEPIYGERDIVDLAAFRKLGIPFWLAGSCAEPERVAEAISDGAQGVQVGTAFAYCEESGLTSEVKQRVLEDSRNGTASVVTDPIASPTGFPFKVVQLEGTLSGKEEYEERTRKCDLGYLREAYKRDDGSLGWRCPAEPVSHFVSKQGNESETSGRKCLCNALMSNIGLGQVRRNGVEEGTLITSGDDVLHVARFLRPGESTYRAIDVIDYLLGNVQRQTITTTNTECVAVQG